MIQTRELHLFIHRSRAMRHTRLLPELSHLRLLTVAASEHASHSPLYVTVTFGAPNPPPHQLFI